jgi:hypothetical protein
MYDARMAGPEDFDEERDDEDHEIVIEDMDEDIPMPADVVADPGTMIICESVCDKGSRCTLEAGHGPNHLSEHDCIFYDVEDNAHTERAPSGHGFTPPGYAPCPREPGHDGPCAHELAKRTFKLPARLEAKREARVKAREARIAAGLAAIAATKDLAAVEASIQAERSSVSTMLEQPIAAAFREFAPQPAPVAGCAVPNCVRGTASHDVHLNASGNQLVSRPIARETFSVGESRPIKQGESRPARVEIGDSRDSECIALGRHRPSCLCTGEERNRLPRPFGQAPVSVPIRERTVVVRPTIFDSNKAAEKAVEDEIFMREMSRSFSTENDARDLACTSLGRHRAACGCTGKFRAPV